jgi:putative ABC transport system permease protein
MIPIKYNLRNLRERWLTTLMAVVSTALVVWASVLTFGFTDGLEHALTITGDPTDLIALRQGSNDETGSTIAPEVARDIANLPGVAKTPQGEPMCSSEYVTILVRPRRDGSRVNLIVRGLDPIGRSLRSNFQIVQGRDVEPGVNEAVTSQSMARRFQNLAIGEKLEINKVQFTVVGYFTANGTSAESEVWTDRRDVTGARRIPDAISSVNLRCSDEAALREVQRRLENDDQFKLKAVRESDYFEDQMSSSLALKVIGFVIAGFLTFGAMFAAANTMYAAVASRAREIGTLRALGFRRRSILFSFVLESVLLCLMGGLLGCLATLPFSGFSTGTANWATFSEITFSFRFGPSILLRGFLMSLAMGLIGGLLPAIRAVRLQIVHSLRQA